MILYTLIALLFMAFTMLVSIFFVIKKVDSKMQKLLSEYEGEDKEALQEIIRAPLVRLGLNNDKSPLVNQDPKASLANPGMSQNFSES